MLKESEHWKNGALGTQKSVRKSLLARVRNNGSCFRQFQRLLIFDRDLSAARIIKRGAITSNCLYGENGGTVKQLTND